jgi:hypothetical protein
VHAPSAIQLSKPFLGFGLRSMMAKSQAFDGKSH